MELTFGENLKLCRTRAGKTLEEIGKATRTKDHPQGYHPNTVSDWEKKVASWKHLPFEIVEALARAIPCSVGTLKKERVA